MGNSYSDIVAEKNQVKLIGVTYGDGDTKLLLNSKPNFIFNSSLELKQFLLEGGFAL